MRGLILAAAISLGSLTGMAGCGGGEKPAVQPTEPSAAGAEHVERSRREMSEG